MRPASIATVSSVMKIVCTTKAAMNFVRSRSVRARGEDVSRLSMDERKCNAYHPRMPLIRCPKCGQSYDVPGAIAVLLPNAIATCHCGEVLAGSQAAGLARPLKPHEGK